MKKIHTLTRTLFTLLGGGMLLFAGCSQAARDDASGTVEEAWQNLRPATENLMQDASNTTNR